MARYLSSPIVHLRAATQKLAAGDLSARAGVPHFRRRDEMSELVRDFDGMAERLEKLAKTQSRLLSDISHELRSPLARLNVALALARQRSGPATEASLDRADREAERLNELIGRLLTVRAFGKWATTLCRKFPVDVCGYRSRIARECRLLKRQSFNCHVTVTSADHCLVMGDPAMLHSAIENVAARVMRLAMVMREGNIVEMRLKKCESSANGPQAVDPGTWILAQSVPRMRWIRCSVLFTGSTTLATVTPAAWVWAWPLRSGRSYCTVVRCGLPIVPKAV